MTSTLARKIDIQIEFMKIIKKALKMHLGLKKDLIST